MTFKELYKKENESIKPDKLLLSQIADKMRDAQGSPQVRPLYTRRRMMYMVSAVATVIVLAVVIPLAVNLGGGELPSTAVNTSTAAGYAGEFAVEETTAIQLFEAEEEQEDVIAEGAGDPEAAQAVPDLMPGEDFDSVGENDNGIAGDETVYTTAETGGVYADESPDGDEILYAVQETTTVTSVAAIAETAEPITTAEPAVTDSQDTTIVVTTATATATLPPPSTTEMTVAETQPEETGENGDVQPESANDAAEEAAADEALVGAESAAGVEETEEAEELIEEDSPVEEDSVDSYDTMTEQDTVAEGEPYVYAPPLPEQKTLGGIITQFAPQGYDIYHAERRSGLNGSYYDRQSNELYPSDYYIFDEILSANVNQPVVKDNYYNTGTTQTTHFAVLPKTAQLGGYVFFTFRSGYLIISVSDYAGEYVVKLASGSTERIDSMRAFVAVYPDKADVKTFGDFKKAFLSGQIRANEYGWVPASPEQAPNDITTSFNDIVLNRAIGMIPSDAAFFTDTVHTHGNMGEYAEMRVQTYFPYSNQSVMFDMWMYFFADGVVRFEVTNFNYNSDRAETPARYEFAIQTDASMFAMLRMAMVGF